MLEIYATVTLLVMVPYPENLVSRIISLAVTHTYKQFASYRKYLVRIQFRILFFSSGALKMPAETKLFCITLPVFNDEKLLGSQKT
jgi:hypothetical protein